MNNSIHYIFRDYFLKYIDSYINNDNLYDRSGDREEPEEKVGLESFTTAFGDNFKDNITLHDIVDYIEKDRKWEVGIIVQPVAGHSIGKYDMQYFQYDEQDDKSKFNPILSWDSDI